MFTSQMFVLGAKCGEGDAGLFDARIGEVGVDGRNLGLGLAELTSSSSGREIGSGVPPNEVVVSLPCFGKGLLASRLSAAEGDLFTFGSNGRVCSAFLPRQSFTGSPVAPDRCEMASPHPLRVAAATESPEFFHFVFFFDFRRRHGA